MKTETKHHSTQALFARTASGQIIKSYRMLDPEVADRVQAYRAQIAASSQTASLG